MSVDGLACLSPYLPEFTDKTEYAKYEEKRDNCYAYDNENPGDVTCWCNISAKVHVACVSGLSVSNTLQVCSALRRNIASTRR